MINDIIIQYLNTFPDNKKNKIDSWNHALYLEEVIQDHLQLYEEYLEEFIKNEEVFKYTIFHDYILVSFLRTELTYYLLVLKKFPIYQDILKKYRELSKEVRSKNKFIRSMQKEAIDRAPLEEQKQ